MKFKNFAEISFRTKRFETKNEILTCEKCFKIQLNF